VSVKKKKENPGPEMAFIRDERVVIEPWKPS
jgi:hypothetical protein